MSTITTRSGKGSPLTHNEVDANFTNLNTDKYQSGDDVTFGSFTSTGIDDNATSTALTVTDSGIAATLTTAAQPNITSVGTLTGFTSTGIDDNATSTAITIDSDGDVGIGLASPLFQAADRTAVTINGTSSSNLVFGVGGSANTYFLADSSGFTIGNTSATLPTMFYTNNAERMRIDSSGNVGIGTGSVSGVTNTAPIVSAYGATSFSTQLILEGNSGAQFVSLISGQSAGNLPSLFFNNGLRFATATDKSATGYSERMRIDSSGNVGIGTSSNIAGINLEIKKAGAYLGLNTTTVGYSLVRGYDNGTERWSIGQIGFGGADGMAFYTGSSNTERMRIDSSGNLLVGTTNVDPVSGNVTGTSIKAQGNLQCSRDDGVVISGNRKSTDGVIFEARKDGTTVGTIGVLYGDNLMITGKASGHPGLEFGGSGILPTDNTPTSSDGVFNFGSASQRWKDLYLSGGAYLGGTGAANYLDDYEEGTFTVTPTFSTSGSATLDRDLLSYTKIGQVVYITGQIEFDTLSSPTGPLTINIPFAAKSPVGSDRETNSFFVGKFQTLNAAPPTGSDGDQVWFTPDGSTMTLQFYNGYTNTATDLDGTYLKSGSRLTITGWYLAT